MKTQTNNRYPSLQTFADGSTIETNQETGNRTVCGSMAHKEYFKRLNEERISQLTSPAIIAYTMNVDGTRKAELIRKNVENPITRFWAGNYAWEVWNAADPDNVIRCRDEQRARELFD